MKTSTENLIELLNDTEMWNAYNEHIISNPDDAYQETTIVEAIEKLRYLKLLIETSIEHVDSISFDRKNELLSTAQQLKRNKYSSIQSIVFIDKFYDLITASGLQSVSVGKKDITSELKSLASQKHKINGLIQKLNDSLGLVDEINLMKERSNSLITIISENLDKSKTDLESLEEKYDSSKLLQSQIEIFYRSIQENEKNIEIKRLSIETFSENVEELKERVQDYESRVVIVLKQEDVIKRLVNEAETALNLKSAQGISAAFASQYDKANNSSLGWWIFGASIFYLIALLMTAWIVGGWHIVNPDSWSSIVGRIVAVGITISAATFCAGQYRRQKMLAEDYAYKAVLSKSIVAFTEEIKKRDISKVAEYLQKVLLEIHKDPQRSRSKRSSSLKFDSQSIIEKIIDKVPTAK